MQVILDERVTVIEEPSGKKYRTETGGETLRADLVFWASGNKPNTGFLAKTMPELLDEHGLIKVTHPMELLYHYMPHIASTLVTCNPIQV